MNVTVKLFAAARECAGTAEAKVDVPVGATVGQLRAALAEQHPALGPLASRSLLAVDAEYAAEDASLPERAEIALIPPVSGG